MSTILKKLAQKYAYKQYIYAKQYLIEHKNSKEEKERIYNQFVRATTAYAQLLFCVYIGKNVEYIQEIIVERNVENGECLIFKDKCSMFINDNAEWARKQLDLCVEI